MSSAVEAGGGERAAAGAEPRLGALSSSARLVLCGSVGFDLALRTLAACAVSAPALAWAAREDLRGDLAQLAFYRELASRADPSAAFPRPARSARITELEPPRRMTFDPPAGRVRMLRFESPFQALNPAVRASYLAHRENRVAWAQHWSHDDGPRPTLAVIHGFGASPYWFNSAFFQLPRLYGLGYDVLLYLMPFHGVRQARLAAFSGWGLFAHGFAHFNEAIVHAVHDFRLFLDHLIRRGAGQVGVTGLSLGGYVAALLAAVEERLALVVPNAPVVEIASLAGQWFPANLAIAGITRSTQTDMQEIQAALAVHCPLSYVPVVPHERRMIIGGLGDRLAPPEQARRLWEHWDRPRLHWYPGGHLLHAGRDAYFDVLLAFMAGNGFAP